MPVIQTPTVAFTQVQKTWDAGKVCYDVVGDSAMIANLYQSRKLYVIEAEQRGTDTVSGKEVLSQDKLDRWTQQELMGEFHAGQLTWAVRTDTGGVIAYDEPSGRLDIYGDLVLPDSRQRTYVFVRCEEGKESGNGYQTRPVSIRIYPETDPEARKVIFYDYNQEGDAADESRSKWLAPKGFSQKVARNLVAGNTALTHQNVNTVRNRVTSKDHRLAGFNTFAVAVDQAWGKVLTTEKEVEEVSKYLDEFWTQLVSNLPDLGIVSLNRRKQVREKSLVGNSLAIYGYMAVAKALWDKRDDQGKVDFAPLSALASDDEWFSTDAAHWKTIGVMVPKRDRETGKVKGHRISNSFQTRKAMADAMLDRMDEISV
jgi:hypothetical protein